MVNVAEVIERFKSRIAGVEKNVGDVMRLEREEKEMKVAEGKVKQVSSCDAAQSKSSKSVQFKQVSEGQADQLTAVLSVQMLFDYYILCLQVEKKLAVNGSEDDGMKRTWFQTHQERQQEKG